MSPMTTQVKPKKTNPPLPVFMREGGRPLRAVLVQPPKTGATRTLLPHFKNGMGDIGFKPPLGLLSIAGTLKARSPHKVFVIDAIAERLTLDQLVRRVMSLDPDVVGISAWTDFWYPAYQSGKLIKESLPRVHIVYGGPHVSIFPGETLNAPFVDSVIAGDGEMPFFYLCNMLSNGRFEGGFPGLRIKSEGDRLEPIGHYVQANLDDLPAIDRTLLPINNYSSVVGRQGTVTTMITSRGCPHHCTFCKMDFQKNVAMSSSAVVDEFRRIRDLGISEVEVYDDTFTLGKHRLKEICQGLIEERMDKDVKWSVRDRVNHADPELLKLMYRAGCRRIHYGVESGVQSVIDRTLKRITLNQARAAVKAAKEARLKVLAHFMFGNAGETTDDMLKTIDFALELNTDYAEFSITIPYPGTGMYSEAMADGTFQRDYWLDHARSPVCGLMPRVLETHASLETIRDIQKQAIRAFYFRPRYMIREAAGLRSFGEFIRKARMGAQLFSSVRAG